MVGFNVGLVLLTILATIITAKDIYRGRYQVLCTSRLDIDFLSWDHRWLQGLNKQVFATR